MEQKCRLVLFRMPCGECLPKLRRLKTVPRAVPVHDPEVDALVWPDERADLCADCAREYRVVLNVRMQLWNNERPSTDFRLVWERFREECPAWIGFRREKPLRSPPRRTGSAADEIPDED